MVLPSDPSSTNHSSPASTSNTSIFNAPTLPKSDMVHAYRSMKRKKIDEIDATHILPKGPHSGNGLVVCLPERR